MPALMESSGFVAASDSDEIPLPSQQPLAVDFIENHTLVCRDSNGTLPAKYDSNKQKFVRRRQKAAVRQQSLTFDTNLEQETTNALALSATEDSFSRAVEHLKSKKGDKKEISSFRLLSDSHSWDEVLQVVQKAESAYSADEGAGGKFRKVFRRLGDNAKSVQPFVGMLPDGSYKTLCGGLTLILTVRGSVSIRG